MNIDIKNNGTTNSNVRNVEAEAFYRGSHAIDIENAIAETDAEFDKLKAIEGERAADEEKRIEAEIGIAAHRLEDAEKRWSFWDEATGRIAPHVWKFVGFLNAGVIMLVGETMLLQKIGDAFGIEDFLFQFVLVGVVVITLAFLCDIAVWMWKRGFNRAVTYTYGAAVLLGLIALGIYRAFILQNLEAQGDADLMRLYDETTILNKLVMVFLTVGLPVGATFAFEYGWYGLRRWKEWRKARRDAVRFKQAHETAVKKLEAAREKREKRIESLEESRKSWKAAQRQAHDEGARLRPRRRPFWEIAPLLAGVSLLIVFVVMFVSYAVIDDILAPTITSDAVRFALYLTLTVALILLFAYRVVRRWNSPSPTEYFDARTVEWHEGEANLLSLGSGAESNEAARVIAGNGRVAERAGKF